MSYETMRIWRWQVNEYRAKGWQFQLYTNFWGWLRPVAVAPRRT